VSEATPAPRLGGAVLCGGRSRRMGTDKALLPIDGAPMAVRVAWALERSGAVPVIAVGGDEPGLRAAGLTVVADDEPGSGPLGGTVTALRHLAEAGAAVAAVIGCDLLHPDPGVIGRLVDALVATAADVAVPSDGVVPQWHVAVWRIDSAESELARCFAEGGRGLHRATAALRVATVDDLDPSAWADADAPEQLPGSLDPGR
jgi:molybdopterin-guanine dinucleotide biosynthesis protein A